MQVIIVNEKGAYARHNGKQVFVKNVNAVPDINEMFFAVYIGDDTVDMPLKNVIIVDAHKEAQKYCDDAAWDSKYGRVWRAIEKWAKIHNVDLSDITAKTYA